MLTPSQATNDAYTALKSGNLDRAEWLARQVLERNGNDVGMLKLLGAIYAGRMDWQEALVHYVAAIEVAETDFEAWNNAGVVWQKLGRLEEARRYVNRAIVLNPEYAQAFFNLGNVAALQGDPEISQGAYQKAIALDPDHAPSYSNLGRLLAAGGDLESAAGLFRHVLKRTPDSADAHLNLGNALQSLGNFEQALAQYNRAIELCPYDARLAHNLASLYREMDDRDSAKLYYLLALKLDGKSAASHHQLGKILQEEGQLQLAIAHLQQAVSFAEGDAAAWRTLGLLWGETGALEGAVACLERSIALVPDFAEAHVDLGRVLLALGLWARGWQELEWRWSSQHYLAKQLPKHRKIERWDGSPLAGRSLLVWSEGDRATVMQFAQFIPRLNTAVVVECEESIAAWMVSVPGVSQVMTKGDPVKADLQIPIGSLPAMLQADDEGEDLVGLDDGAIEGEGRSIDWLKLWV